MFSLFGHRGQLGRRPVCSGECAAGDLAPVLTAEGERPGCWLGEGVGNSCC